MTAHSPDRADTLVAQFAAAVQSYRGPINRARDLCVKIRIDGQDVRLPFFADMKAAEPPSADVDLDDIEKELIQALAEADEPLTVERLAEKSGHNSSTMYGKTQRLPRLVTEGIVVKIRQRGFKLTAFGQDIARAIASEEDV